MNELAVDVAIYKADANVELWFLPEGDFPNIKNAFIAGLFDTVEDASRAAGDIRGVRVAAIHGAAGEQDCDVRDQRQEHV